MHRYVVRKESADNLEELDDTSQEQQHIENETTIVENNAHETVRILQL